MAKAFREMDEKLKFVDLVIVLLDARVPKSSFNPEVYRKFQNKKILYVLTKKDKADPVDTQKWCDYYSKDGNIAVSVNAKANDASKIVMKAVIKLMEEKRKKDALKGIRPKALKAMVVGIPNVGKSSFINKIAGKTRAKAENRPGVTRGNQWFTIDKQLELLDTPGVLWPKFEDVTVGEHLAFTGAVKDNILDTELVAIRLIEILGKNYPELLKNRYGELDFTLEPYDLLCQIGKKRGMVIRGGETDTERAANMIMEEYRNQKIGNISLERVENNA
jgi:ribosome biogenesis GTPase A